METTQTPVSQPLDETLAETVEKELSSLPHLSRFLHGIHNRVEKLKSAEAVPEEFIAKLKDVIREEFDGVKQQFESRFQAIARRIQQLEGRGSPAQLTKAPAGESKDENAGAEGQTPGQS